MGLLSPWFLAGALAVGIPIWVHLIRREQAERIPFSSLMFLRRVPIKSVYRRHLKHLLLLAMRVLVILLIALAFARPYIPSSIFPAMASGRDRRVAIVIDNSMSMQVSDRWERAVSAAGEAVRGLSEADQGQIVSFSSDFEVQNLPTSDKASLLATLGGITPSASTTSYEHAFRAIERIAEDSDRPLAVVLISDMQKAGLGTAAQSLALPPVYEFKAVDVSGDVTPNWAVQDVRVLPRIYRSRYPERLLVQLRGHETEVASKEVIFSLTGKVVQRKTITIPASGTVAVEFESFDVPAGSNRGLVRISPADALPADDAYQFTLERRDPYRLLFIREAGEDAELYYFRNAFGAEPDSPWVLDARTPTEALSQPMSSYAAVILSNIGRLPDALVGELRKLLERGGGIVITAGNRFPARALEEQLKEFWPAQALEKRMLTRDSDRLILLGEFEKDHAVFREMEESGAQSLRAVESYAYLRLQRENKVLLRFANGDPALVEKQWDAGRVLLFASSFDNIWSDFPLHPVFIPFAHQLVRYAAQLPADPAAYRIPTTISLHNYTKGRFSSAALSWDVTGPDGKRVVPLEQERRADYLVLSQPGFYDLRLQDGEHWIAANPDPQESDLTPLSPEDRALWLANSSSSQSSSPLAATAAESEKRQAIWWFLVMLALAIAAIEVYLANPYLGPRRAIVSASGGEAGKENPYVGA
ncbi:MAG: BatA domain-containing protein [Acidobacteria bacterium]|nr:BatA domain-containing protein [Acidobacteriota bacterium]